MPMVRTGQLVSSGTINAAVFTDGAGASTGWAFQGRSRSPSTCLSHWPMWFQLVKTRLTFILRFLRIFDDLAERPAAALVANGLLIPFLSLLRVARRRVSAKAAA